MRVARRKINFRKENELKEVGRERKKERKATTLMIQERGLNKD